MRGSLTARSLTTLIVLAYDLRAARASVVDADFAARCAASGVIRCYGFDDLDDLTSGHPLTLTQPHDGTASRIYPPAGGAQLCTSGQCWALDTTIRSSGAGALRFEFPSSSPADASGAFRMNFRDDFGDQVGPGEDLWVQYRQRFSPEMMRAFRTISGHLAGFKQSIVGLGDRVGMPPAPRCTAEELVFTQRTPYLGPGFYSGCGFWDSMEFSDGIGIRLQAQGPPYCYWPDDPDDGCFRYVANQWMTFGFHVRIGGWGVHPENRVEVWAAREGEPRVLIFDSQFSHPDGYPLHATDATSKIGKVWLTPYHTDKDPTESHPTGWLWYDELIVSRQPIADPAPPPLFESDFEHDLSGWSEVVGGG